MSDASPKGQKGAGVNKGVRQIEMRLLQPAGAGERLGALLQLGAHLAGQGPARDGLRAAREALELSRAAHDECGSGHALALAARCHFQRGDCFAAIASGVDALMSFGDHEPRARADVLRTLALALRRFEDLEHAESAGACAVRLAAGREDCEAAAREAYGGVLAERGRSQQAREELRRAGALYRRVEDRAGVKRAAAAIAHTYRNQANAAQRAGRSEQARLQWRHAVRVYRIGLAFDRASACDAEILAAIAECECGLGDIDAAYEHAGMAVTLAADTAAGATLARARLCESRALQAMGRLPAAERACGHAATAADEAREERLLVECLRAQARLNDLLGRFESAADLEDRARRAEQQHRALLARMRAELAPLLERTG